MKGGPFASGRSRSLENSAQRVDPLGALAARPVTVAAAVTAWLMAFVSTLVRSSDVSSLGAAVAALAAVAAGGVVLVVASGPLRAPVPRTATWALVVCCSAAAVASGFSTAGSNPFVRDDWAGLASGVLILGLAPYRAAREIVLGGSVVGVVISVVALVEAPGFVTPVPAATYVVVAVTPLVALTAASAAFARVFVDHAEAWVVRASGSRHDRVDELRLGLARSVQQDRVTGLNREVVPLFARLVESGRVEAGDADEARRIADSLRASLVADADGSWLASRFRAVDRRVETDVVDPDRLADRLGDEHRTALWALVDAVDDPTVVDVRSMRVRLDGQEARVAVTIQLAVGSSASAARRSLMPYLTVLRLVSGDLRVDRSPSLLTLRFSYDQH